MKLTPLLYTIQSHSSSIAPIHSIRQSRWFILLGYTLSPFLVHDPTQVAQATFLPNTMVEHLLASNAMTHVLVADVTFTHIDVLMVAFWFF